MMFIQRESENNNNVAFVQHNNTSDLRYLAFDNSLNMCYVTRAIDDNLCTETDMAVVSCSY